ncbi:MAG: transporter substrate-binding protein [Frankiales bacterium]|jgi:multiple sugar transport system substrate-binding protein|nr:transporter substrate-binding protein [Frankiales bacterium]
MRNVREPIRQRSRVGGARRRTAGRRRAVLGLTVSALVASLLAGCSSSGGQTPSLTWYINPDNGGQVKLAAECTASAAGAYKIKTSLLPTSATAQRQQLVTRLSAKDSSIALMSVDPVYLPELSEAGFLAPIPAADAASLTQGMVGPAVQAATWQGKLIAAPFFANVQLLWYKKSVAQQAGLDMTQPVTWDQLIKAAQQSKKTVAVQADLYEGYTVWINALIQGAGGKIVENPGAQAKDLQLGLTTDAGAKAAAIIQELSKAGVGGPALSTSEESQSLALFQDNSTAGFMVNYPFVWAALTPAQKADVGFTLYPQTVAGTPSKPPFGGIDIAVGAYTKHQSAALAAMKCLASPAHQAEYMVGEGNPAASTAAYTDPAVLKAFPDGLAAMILQSLQASGPRPQTQYYNDLSTALQKSFSPPSSVNAKTPEKATSFILEVLRGEKLL